MKTAPPSSVASELHLLLALLRFSLGSGDKPPAPSVVDWPRLLQLVERHRVAALLHARTRDWWTAHAPGDVGDRLQAVARANLERALNQAAEQIRMIRALEEKGIEVIAVKGLALSQRLYGGIGVRHVGDIDLFIRSADARAADAVVQAAGFNRSRPDFSLTPLQWEKYLKLKPEFEYLKSRGAVRLELLWRLEGLPVAAAWQGTMPRDLGGQIVRTLPPETDAVYLFQHGARHGWFRLFWLVDVAQLLRDPQVDWPAGMARARELGLERPLLQGAALVEELLGVPAPAALRPRAGEERMVTALATEARRQLIRDLPSHEGVGEWFRQAAYRVRLQKKWRAKFAVAAPHLFSPESWRMWPLPDRWFFLYYVATPFLWVLRRARRG
jgi:hypothetical protein